MPRNHLTILVTGGAGYIGSHFVNRLRKEAGVKIIVVDDFRQSKNNIMKDRRIIYYPVDICDRKKLLGIFKQYPIDIVVHFAGLISVPDSVLNPRDYYQNNIGGGLSLLDCMIRAGVKKVIFSSSAAVYGEPVSEIIDESHPTNPINPYGLTKLIFEKMLADYHEAYRINSISFRYFCAAGCDESLKLGEYHNPETHVIPSIVETLLGLRKEFFVCGNDYPTLDGSPIRDYIHVNDLVLAHLRGLNKIMRTSDICRVYNLGINKGFSVLELIRSAEKISGIKLNYKIKERRPGDPSRLVADSSAAQKELGWRSAYTDIDKIISTAFNFYKSRL